MLFTGIIGCTTSNKLVKGDSILMFTFFPQLIFPYVTDKTYGKQL